MKSEPPRTIFQVKIRAPSRGTSRSSKTLVQVILLLTGMTLFFAGFAAVQVKLCQDKAPKKTVEQCLLKRGTKR